MTESAPDHFASAAGMIRRGETSALQLLLDEHPELVDLQPEQNRRSLLHHATDWPGHWPNVADSIRALAERGANIEPRLPSDSSEVDGFFARDGSVDAEMNLGPNDDQPPDSQVVLDRAFQFACRAGHLDIAKKLLMRGANPSAISPANTTAVEMAVQNRHHAVARWINTILPTD